MALERDVSVVRMRAAQKTYAAGTGRKRTQSAGRTIGPVSLEVARGEWLAIRGANASGKSTVLSMIAGALTPDDGEVTWFGGPLTLRTRGRIGVVFQQPALDDLLTAREALAVAGRVMRMDGPRLSHRIETLARNLAFSDRLRDRVGTLSGGLRRRVDLARAVLHEPGLLLLDEPTAGLDVESRTAFLQLVSSLRDQGVAVIAATHADEEAERADRAIEMAQGLLVGAAA